MKKFRADLYFADQHRRMACGWRRCTVQVGRRWLRITEDATGTRIKLAKRMVHKHRRRLEDTLSLLGYKPVGPA